ncbi:MAG TPA: NADH-quinone oxidoreductase subunit N [Candidatus Saccharimonadales bacterium]|nr:NADH-quinone oxidoreductase subunit N [Candidatus Saccharimonadales bacterium]
MNLPTLNAIRSYLQGDGSVILPEMELVLFALGILVIDFWVQQKEKYWNAALAFAGTVFSGMTLWMLRGQLATRGDLIGFHETAIVDSYFLFFSALFLIVAALLILLSIRYLELANEQRGSYYALILLACAGMMLMVSGIDLLVIFLGIETMALAFFALTSYAIREKQSGVALQYALTSAFSSALMVFGFSLLYGLSGSTNIGRIASALAQHSDLVRALALSREHGAPADQMRQLIQERIPIALQFDPHALQFLPLAALLLVAAGVFFKLSAAPFHVWSLAIYRDSPTPIAAFLGAGSVAAALSVLLRLLMTIFASFQQQWLYLLTAVAVLSILWGALGALRESSLKPLVAYSIISQVGCILLGMVAGNEAGLTGITFYLFSGAFAVVGTFAILIVLRQHAGAAETLSDLEGLFWRHPAVAFLLAVFVFSLTGVPGTSGFLGKYYIFKALLETKHKPFVVAALICLLPSLFVLGRILLPVFRKPSPEARRLPHPAMSSAEAIVLGTCVFVTIAAGLYPEPFLRLARYAFGQ